MAIPVRSSITRVYESMDLADAFSIRLPAEASADPVLLARFIFSQQPPWVGALMTVRDALVWGFGLKTGKHLASMGGDSSSTRLGIFRIYSTSETEIVLGEDDKHLDFRASVLCSDEPTSGGARHLTLSTVVRCHNRLGRTYILLIAPFHRLVVQSSLRRAARMGWPQAPRARV
ncbi:DUF2867 domain-containing protein [Hydrogenophaga sp.]|uniref:DUF2867 domain-containing protein n=1 Tax=Hydrogenophaga sp. TaxID=1904254 RepID=UPI0025B99E54|nr:DUF2867 domain-containing protein [Hydrogenophaga sp.]